MTQSPKKFQAMGNLANEYRRTVGDISEENVLQSAESEHYA